MKPGRPLPKLNAKAPSSPVKAVNDATFEREVLQSEQPVLVDFWAPWCGPCRAVAPIVEQIAVEYQGRAKVVKLDTEASGGVPSRYGIRAIPTLLVFKGGQVVDSRTGAGSADVLRAMLDRALGEKKTGLISRLFN
jgi:thioredoxin 1